MTEILTAAQMRALEAAAIASGRVTGLDLMERAGAAVVEAIEEFWPEMAGPGGRGRRAVILCGPGNNGGDGFVVARLLYQKGWRVDVFLSGTPQKLPADARTNHDRWAALGPVHPLPALHDICENGPRGHYSLFIDAAFGIGLSRPLPATIPPIFQAQASGRLAAHALAIDIPSGLCADTGTILCPPDAPADTGPGPDGRAFVADLTVTFHALKRGHVLATGPRCCGRLVVKSIGL